MRKNTKSRAAAKALLAKVSHKTERVEHEGRSADIDTRIAPLILAMWERGIDTLACCEGTDDYVDDGDPSDWAYVLFPTHADAQKLVALADKHQASHGFRWSLFADGRFSVHFPSCDIEMLTAIVRGEAGNPDLHFQTDAGGGVFVSLEGPGCCLFVRVGGPNGEVALIGGQEPKELRHFAAALERAATKLDAINAETRAVVERRKKTRAGMGPSRRDLEQEAFGVLLPVSTQAVLPSKRQ